MGANDVLATLEKLARTVNGGCAHALRTIVKSENDALVECETGRNSGSACTKIASTGPNSAPSRVQSVLSGTDFDSISPLNTTSGEADIKQSASNSDELTKLANAIKSISKRLYDNNPDLCNANLDFARAQAHGPTAHTAPHITKAGTLNPAHAITATPEQQQALGQPKSPITQATNASVVGPGNSPSTNPIGAFGALAANPGQVTGNSALGVKNNVLKMAELVFGAQVSKQAGVEPLPRWHREPQSTDWRALVTDNSGLEQLLSSLGCTLDDRGHVKVSAPCEAGAKQAGTKFKTNTSYDPICPHCDEVMYERHFVPDREQSGMWRHRGDCYDKGAFKITWPDQHKRDAEHAAFMKRFGLDKKGSGDMLAFKAWKATGLSDAEADRKAGESLALPKQRDMAKPKIVHRQTKQALVGPAVMPQRRKRRRQEVDDSGIPGLAVGAGLLGAAGIGGAHAIASNAQAANVQQAVTRAHTPLAPYETQLDRYNDVMSVGAGMKPFGVPMGRVLTAVRGNQTLMNMAGTPTYTASKPGQIQESLAHYGAYEKGPIPAYYHMLTKGIRGGTNIKPLDPKVVGTAKNYHEVIQPHFDKFFGEWRSKQQQPPNGFLAGGSSRLEPYELDTQVVPHKAQLQFIRDFHESLPPELQAARKTMETDVMGPGLRNENMKNYLPVMEKGLQLRNMLKDIGITSTGAAGGALAGHYLHRAFSDRKKPRGLGYYASVLGGAGLGGAASYFGGTQHGMATLQRLLGTAQKQAGVAADILHHPATPFVARPLIGATASLGVNELVRRLTDAYVGKPSSEQQIRRDRLIAAGMGAGMGLVGAGMPHVESAVMPHIAAVLGK